MALPTTLGVVSLAVLAALAAVLSYAELRRFIAGNGRAHLYWGVGLVLVVVTLLEEAAFFAGVVADPLLRSYLFLVALLVGILSLGSAETGLSRRIRRGYSAFVLLVSVVLAFFSFTEPITAPLVAGGVVSGNPPVGILLASTLLTVPAAVLMTVLSLFAAYRQRRPRLALVAAGILVISVAGGLYVASFPMTLYAAEFVGVVLLFLGFGGFRPLGDARPASEPHPL